MVEHLKGYLDFLVRPEAEYFLKANDEYYEAVQLSRSGQYSEAVDRFENIERVLAAKEPELNKTSNSWMTLLYAGIPLTFVVIAVCFILIKRKKDERTI